MMTLEETREAFAKKNPELGVSLWNADGIKRLIFADKDDHSLTLKFDDDMQVNGVFYKDNAYEREEAVEVHDREQLPLCVKEEMSGILNYALGCETEMRYENADKEYEYDR